MLHETIFCRQDTATTCFHLHNNILGILHIGHPQRLTLYDLKLVHHPYYSTAYEMDANMQPC